jgi:carbamoyltransferase
VDGFGDFTSCMVATGRDKKIHPLVQVHYPHSLGVFYSALTQFLGFPDYGDEYKVMGLAGFGQPQYIEPLRKLVRLKPNGFDLDLSFFQHHVNGDEMQWNGTAPTFGRYYSGRLVELLGKPRSADEPITDFHTDLAASVQAVYEQALFHILDRASELTRSTRLCLAGGCALNSLANGKIYDHTPFQEVYIPPGAHDAGGCIGAAYYVWHHVLGRPRSFVMRSASWGPQYDEETFSRTVAEGRNAMNGCSVARAQTEEELIRWTVDRLTQGKIVGWFQGRMEWGPRALGNRSILADPRRADMRDTINAKIKFRERFRPFAPSILEEYVGEYFEKTHPDPFMVKVYPIRPDKRRVIPAVTHVDGTGRLQTVDAANSPLYWKLIKAFGQRTGVPVLLNTSFNENEPIVCRPEEALACFLRTKMDVLVIGNWIVERL